jgi:hypothetical protein
MLTKRAVFWLIPFIIVGSAIGAVLLYPTLYARYLVHELEELQVNHSTFADAQKFAKKISAQERTYMPCTPAECQWYKLVDNARLPQWYRGKGATFAILFTVKHSIVTEKAVWYEIGVGLQEISEAMIGRPGVTVFQSDGWFEHERELERQLRVKQRKAPGNVAISEDQNFHKGWGKIWYDRNGNMVSDSFNVSISPSSKSVVEDWDKYTTLNYSCFWKYKGCSHANDLLPIIDPYPPH